MAKQTAGRDSLGTFAPKFAELNDDVLFGEVWSREGQLSLKMRSILTVSALVSKGMLDNSFHFHLANAKKNGVTQGEMAEILTHLAFYAGWPNAWAAFRMAVDVYRDDEGKDGGLFGIGAPNDAYAKYFTGNSYLNPLPNPQETGGRGWYQEWGKNAQKLFPGTVVAIPTNVKHWHGAAKDSWFSHVAIECPGDGTSSEWCEPVSAEQYNVLA